MNELVVVRQVEQPPTDAVEALDGVAPGDLINATLVVVT